MDLRVLGPVEAWDGGRVLEFPRRQQRLLLGILALHANRIVTTDRLIELIWADRPPLRARAVIHSRMSEIRTALATARSTGRPTVTTHGDGYRLDIAADRVDAEMFTALVARARTDPSDGAARDLFRRALALWRGPVLGGGPAAAHAVLGFRLESERLTATEDLHDIELRLGHHHAVADQLVGLLGGHPGRERLCRLTMLALHRAGRGAEAIRAYDRCRRHLADELGVDPGTELQQLHVALLRGGEPQPPAVGRPAVGRPAVVAAGPAISQLPRPAAHFTGQGAALRRLCDAGAAGGGVRVLAIDGMAGSGKTTLAVHAATRLTATCPDGALFVDLHGHSDTAPLPAAAALHGLLRQLAVDASAIPDGTAERSALWRAELAGRRMVVVLDNAADEAQLNPLIPGGGGSVFLVTSRRRLVDLDTTVTLALDPMAEPDAIALLRSVVGVRIDQEPDAATELVRHCGRLPLALRIAAARLAHRPGWRVADLNLLLAEPQARLSSIAAAFASSYRELPEPLRRTFRRLALHPPAEFEAPAVAAIAGTDTAAARERLESLVDIHLLESPEAGRFRLHDLLRDYAAQALAQDPPADVDAARTRMFDHYLHMTAAATDHMVLHWFRRTPVPGEPPVAVAGRTAEEWVTWLGRETTTVIDLIGLANETGRHDHSWRLSMALWPYLSRTGMTAEVMTTQASALVAARRVGDPVAEAMANNYLAHGHAISLRGQDSVDHLHRAMALFQQAGDHSRVMGCLANLAMTQRYVEGRFGAALRTGRRMGALLTELRDPELAVQYHKVLGETYLDLGRYRSALPHLRRVAAVLWRRRDTASLATILHDLGNVHSGLGHRCTALALLHRAATVKARHGYRLGRAETLTALATLHRRAGEFGVALRYHQQALDLLADRGSEAVVTVQVRFRYAQTLLASGDRDGALAAFETVLPLAERLGHRAALGICLAGAADATDAPADDPRRIRAAVLFAEAGLPGPEPSTG